MSKRHRSFKLTYWMQITKLNATWNAEMSKKALLSPTEAHWISWSQKGMPEMGTSAIQVLKI